MSRQPCSREASKRRKLNREEVINTNLLDSLIQIQQPTTSGSRFTDNPRDESPPEVEASSSDVNHDNSNFPASTSTSAITSSQEAAPSGDGESYEEMARRDCAELVRQMGEAGATVNLTYAPKFKDSRAIEMISTHYDCSGSTGIRIECGLTSGDDAHPATNLKVYTPFEAVQIVKRAIVAAMPRDTTPLEGCTLRRQQSSSGVLCPVNPQINKIEFFNQNATLDDNKYKPSNKQIMKKIKRRLAASLNDLLDKNHSERLLVLIGAAGAGKTTSSIRLAERFNEDPDNVCFRFEFKRMKHDMKLTLQDMLLKHLNLSKYIQVDPNLRKKEKQKRIFDIKEKAFEWIEEHDNNLLLIFDGYDQFTAAIDEIPPPTDHEAEMPIKQLITSLCYGDLLPNCSIILTSRSHAMYSIVDDLKPRVATYLLSDLSDDDMIALLRNLAGEKAETLRKVLEEKAPHLHAICHSPLLLRMFVGAATCKDPKEMTTMTRVYQAVLQNLSVHGQLRGKGFNESLIDRLCEIAYKSTVDGTVVISTEYSDDLEKAQGFIFTVPGSNEVQYVLDGKHQVFFSHQTYQEHFAAQYISKQMTSDQDFKDFVEKKLCDPYWFVVSQFLCGIVVDLGLSGDLRKSIIINRLVEKMKEYKSTGIYKDKDLLRLCALVRECNDDDVMANVASFLPELVIVNLHTPSDGHALGCSVRMCRRVSVIETSGNSATLLPFLKEVAKMKGRIEKLRIGFRIASSDDVDKLSEAVFLAASRVLGKITEKLKVYRWLRNQSKEFIVEVILKLKEALNAEEGCENIKVLFCDDLDDLPDETVNALQAHGDVEEDVEGDQIFILTRQL